MARPPAASSPLPSSTWAPRSSSSATSASTRAFTTPARTSESCPSGRCGKVFEHVVGHDEPEHGVAEELEAFVRLDFAVLRAPRPVRERAEEQRRVGEVHTERRFELGRRLERRDSHDPLRVAIHEAPGGSCETRHSTASPDRLQLDEIFVVDRETDRSLAQLGLDRVREVEQREVVGVEVFAQARVERHDGRRRRRGSRRAVRTRCARPRRGRAGWRWLWVSAGTRSGLSLAGRVTPVRRPTTSPGTASRATRIALTIASAPTTNRAR